MKKIINKANKAIDIIINASQSSEPSKFFGRKFDDIFENGNSKEIVCEIVRKYLNDITFQEAVKKVNHWIGIDNWIATYNKMYPKSLLD